MSSPPLPPLPPSSQPPSPSPSSAILLPSPPLPPLASSPPSPVVRELPDLVGKGLLNAAAAAGYWPVFEKIIKNHRLHALDLLSQDVRGDTPLHAAARAGHFNAVIALIEAGMQPHILEDDLPQTMVSVGNNFLQTPVHLAVEAGHVAVLVRLLQECKAASTLKDANDELPLHYAARLGSVACVRVLAAFGGVCYSVNVAGKTALQLAAAEGHVNVVLALLYGPSGGPRMGLVRDAMVGSHPKALYALLHYATSEPVPQPSGSDNAEATTSGMQPPAVQKEENNESETCSLIEVLTE